MTIRDIADIWKRKREKRNRPCCKCIEPPNLSLALSGLTGEGLEREREEIQKRIRSCCGENPEEHHEMCDGFPDLAKAVEEAFPEDRKDDPG